MLATEVFIDSPASIGSGQYTLRLYFSQLTLAKYLNIGDYIQDTADNQYEVIALASTPYFDGSQVTVQFITTDVLPAQDDDYNSLAFTPGQQDVRPLGKTEININNAVVFDSQNYEYTVTITVGSLQEANKIVVGDSIVDLNGKEYEITFIDSFSRFNVPCRAKEVHKEGQLPSLGVGSMYQGTDNIGLFRGTPISDPARTVIRNRDNYVVDAKIKELQDSINAIGGGGSGEIVLSSYANNTGNTIQASYAVCSSALGELKVLDVSNEDEVQSFKGVTTEPIINGSSGQVAKIGLIKDVTTVFSHQDAIYVAKDGSLTNTAPEIGVDGFVEGDFVIYIGHISKNESNPTLKDLELKPKIVGQL